MLGTLRKHSRSVIIYVLFAIIIVVFVFTFNVSGPEAGCSGDGGGAKAALVSVGDTKMDASDLFMGLALTADPPGPGMGNDPRSFQAELIYRSTRFARRQGDPKFRAYIPDPTRVSMIKVRKVMDDLEETWLVSEAARAQGLRAGVGEARDRIVPDFTDSEGVFKKRRYENWVRWGLKTSLGRFEDFVKRELLREKMIALVTSNVSVSDREARLAAKLRKEIREYEWVEVSPSLLAQAIRPTPLETDNFLQASLDIAKKYFEDHAAEYQVEPAYDFHVTKFSAASRRIMASIQDPEQRKMLESSWSAAKDRADKAAARLAGLGGAELLTAFEALAREVSDDSKTRDRGGRVEAPVPVSALAAMEPAVFSALSGLEIGQASGLVNGDDGYYLLFLDGKTPGEERTFEQVKDRVAGQLIAQKQAGETAKVVADSVLARSLAAPTRRLFDVATEANLPFAPQSPVKYGSTGRIPSMPTTLSGLAGWSPSAIPGLGESEELAAALMDLTTARPVPDKVFQLPGAEARYVVRLKSATTATEPDEAEIAAARDDLLPVKRQAYYRDWYKTLRNQAASEGRFVEHETLAALVREEMRTHEEAVKQAAQEPGSDK